MEEPDIQGPAPSEPMPEGMGGDSIEEKPVNLWSVHQTELGEETSTDVIISSLQTIFGFSGDLDMQRFFHNAYLSSFKEHLQPVLKEYNTKIAEPLHSLFLGLFGLQLQDTHNKQSYIVLTGSAKAGERLILIPSRRYEIFADPVQVKRILNTPIKNAKEENILLLSLTELSDSLRMIPIKKDARKILGFIPPHCVCTRSKTKKKKMKKAQLPNSESDSYSGTESEEESIPRKKRVSKSTPSEPDGDSVLQDTSSSAKKACGKAMSLAGGISKKAQASTIKFLGNTFNPSFIAQSLESEDAALLLKALNKRASSDTQQKSPSTDTSESNYDRIQSKIDESRKQAAATLQVVAEARTSCSSEYDPETCFPIADAFDDFLKKHFNIEETDTPGVEPTDSDAVIRPGGGKRHNFKPRISLSADKQKPDRKKIQYTSLCPSISGQTVALLLRKTITGPRWDRFFQPIAPKKDLRFVMLIDSEILRRMKPQELEQLFLEPFVENETVWITSLRETHAKLSDDFMKKFCNVSVVEQFKLFDEMARSSLMIDDEHSLHDFLENQILKLVQEAATEMNEKIRASSRVEKVKGTVAVTGRGRAIRAPSRFENDVTAKTATPQEEPVLEVEIPDGVELVVFPYCLAIMCSESIRLQHSKECPCCAKQVQNPLFPDRETVVANQNSITSYPFHTFLHTTTQCALRLLGILIPRSLLGLAGIPPMCRVYKRRSW